MLNISVKVNSISKLNKYINYVNKLAQMKTDTRFQKYIQEKALYTVNRITEQRLVGGTTNDAEIELYKDSNQIRETSDGFILFNDASIPANAKDTSNYPNGEFPIALAFEYGVGIIGSNTDNPNAWEYNVNNYNFGWYYWDDEEQKYAITGGYQGFEIYRYALREIQTMLPKWVNDYFKQYGGASQ